MALTEIYVDPSLASDTGTGTDIDPYGDLEYAIEQETFDTVNGTRVNVKSGTDEIVASQLGVALADVSVSVAWAPSISAPLIFQGYTAAAADGGIGGISGGGSISVIDSGAQNYVTFIDMRLHNCGAAQIAHLNDSCSFINCEVYNSTGNGINADAEIFVFDCYIHNIGGIGAVCRDGLIRQNFFENGTNKMTIAASTTNGGIVDRNLISLDSTSIGIRVSHGGASQNSIYSVVGSGTAIELTGVGLVLTCMNNVIEGFSGSGGIGIDQSDTSMTCMAYGANSIYNCETEVSGTLPTGKAYIANETLTQSPFTDPINGDFSPVDTGAVKEGSQPQAFNEG